MSSLQGQVDTPFDELIFTLLQCLVKGIQIAFLDTLCQGQKKLLEVWIGF